MKQLLHNLNTGALEVVELPTPTVKRGHVLIETRQSLISSGTERMLLSFGKASMLSKVRQQPEKVARVLEKVTTDGLIATITAVKNKLAEPVALGYSNVGVVRAIGEGVRGFAVGDRVVSNGSHAELVCVPQHLCARIPDVVDDTSAVFTVTAAIALQGIRLLQPTMGESVAVIGLGLLGLEACALLRAHGCRVLGFDLDPGRVARAQASGAEAYVLDESVNPLMRAEQFGNGYGVDAVLITASTDSDEPIHLAAQMCRKRGRVVLVGVIGLQLRRDDFFKKEISFQVSCSYGPGRYDPTYEEGGQDYPLGFVRWTEQRNFEAVLALLAEQRIRVRDLVTDTVPFAEASRAYDALLADPKALGIVLSYAGAPDITTRTVRLHAPSVRRIPSPVVVGVIGAGSFARGTLLPALAATGVRRKTIAGTGGFLAFLAARSHGFEMVTSTHATIMNDPEITAVIIATRHDTHASLVIDALRAGKHVYVEKPLCLTRDELTAIRRAAADTVTGQTPRILMVGFNRRFSPLLMTMRERLHKRRAPMYLILTVNAGALPSDHWTRDPQIGGGRIIGEGCHFIDLARFLVNSPMTQCSTTTGPTPDSATITMTFADTSTATVHYVTNGHARFPKERLDAFCDGAVFTIDNFRSLTAYRSLGVARTRSWRQDKGHTAALRAFVNAIRDGGPAPIPFAELMEVTERTCDAAAGTHRPL